VVHAQLVPVVLVELVAQVLLALAVPVAQAVRVVSQALRAQVLAAVLRVELQVPVDLIAQAVAQVAAVVVVLAVELPVLLVRVVLAVRARLVSQSVQSAKSLNSAPMLHRWVERLFHAVTALLSCVCVAVHRFRISRTRLTPQLVS
jgi:hypothetical protein